MNTPRRASLKLREGVRATAAVSAFLLLAAVPAFAQGVAHRGGGTSSGSSGGGSAHSSGSSGSSSSGHSSGHTTGHAPRTAHPGTPSTGQRQPSRFHSFHS